MAVAFGELKNYVIWIILCYLYLFYLFSSLLIYSINEKQKIKLPFLVFKSIII